MGSVGAPVGPGWVGLEFRWFPAWRRAAGIQKDIVILNPAGFFTLLDLS